MASSVPSQHADWLVPDWPAPPGVHALCTTRAGGVSRAPYDQLNLGAHVGDDPQAVAANRQILQSALQSTTPGARAVFLNQVHGDGVALLDASTPDGTEADACVATEPGAVCTIMVADCLPVLLAPHRGVSTMDCFKTLGRSSAEKIFDALDGKLPANCLNPEARQG